MFSNLNMVDVAVAHARAGLRSTGRARFRGEYVWTARGPGILKNPKTGLYYPGPVLWVDENHNLVVNQGLNHILNVHFNAATQITTWYLALLKTGAGSPAATSTYQNFMGTANQEVTAYDEANRQTFVEGAASGQSLSNVGNLAVFTISANGTVIGGTALVSNNTKNDNGAGPFMFSAGAFSGGDRTLGDNDTLSVQLTISAADDGV